jgi:hypothetical protein
MSIQEFHSRLTLIHEHDALMAKLHRLSTVEDIDTVISAATEPNGGWGSWTGGPAAQ